ncbi:MAG: regulatory protein RecX [Oliverpabstia sp.]
MMITEILPVTKQKYRVVTDEQLAFILYKGELSHYHLQAGRELTEQEFRTIQEEVLIKRAKLRAMHLLTGRDYTELQLRKKLEQGEYTKEAVDIAIEYVHSWHYLDDQRYMEHYLAAFSGNKSRRQLEQELQQKGISKEMIAAFREKQEDVGETQDETEMILELLKKRCKDPRSADEKEKRRHYAYLMRKGFDSGDIRRAWEQFFTIA